MIFGLVVTLINKPKMENSEVPIKNDVSVAVKSKPKPKKVKPKALKSPELPYEIVKKEDVSYLNTPRMVYRVVLSVDEAPNEDKMKEVAQYLWENGNTNWKEFTVFLYLPSMNSNSAAYGIGEFRPEGLLEFKVNEWTLSL